MDKEQEKVLKMSVFIKDQLLNLLGKLEALDLDDAANDCEELYDLADSLSKTIAKEIN